MRFNVMVNLSVAGQLYKRGIYEVTEPHFLFDEVKAGSPYVVELPDIVSVASVAEDVKDTKKAK